MQLIDATIENYMSLKRVDISFTGLTILVGKNGSGKTSLLEALHRFFTDFSATGGGIPSGVTDYFWFDRDTLRPISLSVNLQLSQDEYNALLPPPLNAILENLRQRYGDMSYRVSACRELVNPQLGWRSTFLRLADVAFIKDDRLVDPTEVSAALAPKSAERVVLYFFTPQKYTGDRLLVDEQKKVAYHSSPNIDMLAGAGVVRTSSEAEGENFREWCNKSAIKLVERPPEPNEMALPSQPVTVEVLNALVASLAASIKGKFRLIPALRDNKTSLGVRTPVLDQQTLDSIRALSLSITRSDELKWDKFRHWVEDFLGKDTEPNPGGLLVRDSDLRVPIHFIGGGEQEVFGLMWGLLDPGLVLAIEEPENHFHAEYLRKLFKFFKEFSSKETQVIISTHSPLLVDRKEVSNNWVLSRRNKETSIKRLAGREDLRLVLAELGVVPSDIYLKDFVLFVEGGTEREAVLPVLGERLGVSLEETAIISLGGKDQLKNYLRIWLNLIEYAPVPYIIFLDKDSEQLAYELVREVGIEIRKFLILSEGSIEDCYPKKLVVSAVKELYGVSLKEEDLGRPLANYIKGRLEKEGKIEKGWKKRIGEYVASRMVADEIPKDIRDLFDAAVRKGQT